MSAKLDALTILANRAIATEENARKRLAECLMNTQFALIPSEMKVVLEAEAKARPFRRLLAAGEGDALLVELVKVRKYCTSQLLNNGVSTSSCPITNAASLMEQDGMRSFLSLTEMFTD